MKKTLLIILLLTPFFLTAQRSLKKAVLITSSNETLSGYIDDKEWLVNPSSIRYKQSPSENFKEFKAEELKSVTIENGDRYISSAVTYEEAPTEVAGEKMDTSLIIHKTEPILLLLEYASADFSLYSFSKNNRQHFFIQQKQEAPQELIYRSYTVKLGGSVFEREENAYWKQLNKLFGDCSRAIDKIGTLQFKEKYLTKILSVYTTECGSKKIDFVNNTKKKRTV